MILILSILSNPVRPVKINLSSHASAGVSSPGTFPD